MGGKGGLWWVCCDGGCDGVALMGGCWMWLLDVVAGWVCSGRGAVHGCRGGMLGMGANRCRRQGLGFGGWLGCSGLVLRSRWGGGVWPGPTQNAGRSLCFDVKAS